MVEIPLKWRVSMEGAEELKARFNEISSAFERGEIIGKQFTQQMREMGREANTMNNIGQVQNRIFLAANPGLNALNRTFSNFSHVANTTLSIMNAINLATIAQTGISAALADQKISEQEAWRAWQLAIAQYGKDSMQAKDAEEKWRIEHEKTGNLIKQQDQQNSERLINLGAAIVLIAGSMTQMIAKAPEFIRNFQVMGATISAFSWASLGPYIAVAVAIAAIAEAIIFIGAALGITQFQEWADAQAGIFGGLSKFIIKLFTIDWPNAISSFMQAIWGLIGFLRNTLMTIWQGIWENDLVQAVKNGLMAAWTAITGWVTSIVNLIKSMFSGGSSSGGTNSTFNPSTGGVKPPGRAQGFDGVVTSPTLFYAGEAGPERVTIGQPGGGGAMMINNITIQGSVWAERQIMQKVDDYLKQRLKDVGFK